VQGAEKPHGPHRLHSQETQAKGHVNGNFGAGIFD
jgi:hypothetical protein